MKGQTKRITSRLGLVAVSVIAGLGICEGIIRFAYPKYEYSAKSAYDRETNRIWARTPNVSYYREHPDTGERHLVRHNNLALRHHRDFSDEDLQDSTVLGFFGDSFVENLRLPVQHSFTEPLDFLLNQSGRPFNVLNFGVDGYGTDQSFLQYREFTQDHKIDHVFYVFSSNDLRNIRENRLFELDESGSLLLQTPPPSPLWVRFVSRFYLTYFFIERVDGMISHDRDPNKLIDLDAFLNHAENYHAPEADQAQSDFVEGKATGYLDETIRLFTAILREWKREVEANGGRFHVVLLPRYSESLLSTILPAKEFEIIDLFARFSQSIENFDYSQIRFENDGHWNEFGNAHAANELYGTIAFQLDLQQLDERQIESLMNDYQSTFKE